jgi:acetyl-CoA acyltransferase
MLAGLIPATHKALQRSGLSIKEINAYEVNEFRTSAPPWAIALNFCVLCPVMTGF